MKRWICNVHRNQVGLGVLATILILLLVTGGLATGTLVMMDKLGIGLVTWPWEKDEAPFISPDRFGAPYGFGCKTDSYTTNVVGSNMRFAYVTMQEDVLINAIELQVGRSSSTPDDNYKYVCVIRAGGIGSGTELGRSAVYSNSQFEYIGAGIQPYRNFVFEDAVFLPAGSEVSFWTLKVAGGTTSKLRAHSEAQKCAQPAWFMENYRNFYVSGWKQAAVRVHTGGWSQPGDGSVVVEGWADIYGYSMVGFYWGVVEADVEAGEANIAYGGSYDPSGGAVQFFDGRILGAELGVTYYYAAFVEVVGTIIMGDVESFARVLADELPIIAVSVSGNDINGLAFQVQLSGTQAGQDWGLAIEYGKTLCAVRGGLSRVEVAQNVTEDGNYPVIVSDWDAGYRYYYRARGEELGGAIILSGIDSLVVYDPSQPGWINWFGGITGASGPQIWWGFAALALAFIWLVAGVTKWWWLGVVLTFLLIGVLIYFGMLSPWVVVLMSLIGGWIVFKVVFKHSGSTGS